MTQTANDAVTMLREIILAPVMSAEQAARVFCDCIWEWPETDGSDSTMPDYYCNPACLIHGASAFE